MSNPYELALTIYSASVITLCLSVLFTYEKKMKVTNEMFMGFAFAVLIAPITMIILVIWGFIFTIKRRNKNEKMET